MILALLLAMQGYSPETSAVMDRSRREAATARAATPTLTPKRKAGANDGALPLPPVIAAKLQVCLDTAIANPVAGVTFASNWVTEGGGYNALQCRGFAHARAEQWDQAASAFDLAATQAQKADAPGDAARLRGQAGNAALAGGHADVATGYFDAALGGGLPDGLAKGEIYLDRARAQVALGNMKAARADMDRALVLAPQDPLAWLLSATLARRSNELVRATTDITEAAKRAPDDPSVAMEQGNIAVLTGRDDDARAAWTHVLKLTPKGEQADAARASLTQLDAPAVK